VESLLGGNVREKNLLILPSARTKYMVDHIPYFFRQDTDFRYLTGCLQSESVLVMEFSRSCAKSYLFMKENTVYDEKWEGKRFGFTEAVDFFGVDEVFSIHHLEEFINRATTENPALNLWYDLMEPRDGEVHKNILSAIAPVSQGPGRLMIEPIRQTLHQLRVLKSAAEAQLMRKSCEIGAAALRRTIAASPALRTELDLLATVDYESKIQGANHLAYPPVVAAGNNATVIHHISASGPIADSDIVLLDSGCEYHGYSSDVTRSWPVSGQFTDAQRILYEIVLECQTELIRGIQPDSTSIDGMYRNMQKLLGKGLQSAGLISSNHDEATATRFAHLFCPHNVGHHLGMDVHDCGTVPKSRPLVAGNVITVEPGVYIPNTNKSVPEEFRGIGIRIEDDILITDSGCDVLTASCPKSPQEIENIVQASSTF